MPASVINEMEITDPVSFDAYRPLRTAPVFEPAPARQMSARRDCCRAAS